nr:type III-B CRISPR module RAMP protein Cmr6 [Paenibacillus sp. GSMTC-2017]
MIFESTSNLWIGTGSHSILDTMLSLHRIYGVPYIPGTALKGVAAHYCHSYLGLQNEKFLQGGEWYTILFGSQDQQSFIYYYDAFPTPETVAASLRRDIMTPHHTEYNMSSAGQARNAPRDDDSPVPHLFMSAKADFNVMLSCENNDDAGREWLNAAKRILIQAIQQEGVGGKTNVGYGRFKLKEG